MLPVARPAFPPLPLVQRSRARVAADVQRGLVAGSVTLNEDDPAMTSLGGSGLSPTRDKPLVLIVDDEHDLVELITMNLQRNGFDTIEAGNGDDALEMTRKHRPDLVLLDLMLPGLDGTEVARRLRSEPQTKQVPIVMLTAKTEETDIVVGLTIGADDYVAKPFSPKVLMARVKAVLRRRGMSTPASGSTKLSAPTGPGLLEAGPLLMDLDKHEVRVGSETVKLTLTEFKLLKGLVEAGGRVLSRDRLMDKAMGADVFVTDRAIDVHVTAIRKKLGSYSWLVHTVRGVGYRLQEVTPETN